MWKHMDCVTRWYDTVETALSPVHTIYWNNVVLTLVHHLRRWPTIKPTLASMPTTFTSTVPTFLSIIFGCYHTTFLVYLNLWILHHVTRSGKMRRKVIDLNIQILIYPESTHNYYLCNGISTTLWCLAPKVWHCKLQRNVKSEITWFCVKGL